MTHLKRFLAVVQQNKLFFLTTFFVTVFVTYAFLYIIDFYPEPKEESETAATYSNEVNNEDETAADVVVTDDSAETIDSLAPSAAAEAALPVTITIDKLDRTIPVENPTSNTIADLDAALLSGVVRHPDSADFTEPGNIFILGHSSYLPNVLNKNFQAFNGLQDLRWGDEIYVDSADTRYTYRVQKVYEAKASDVIVPHTPGEARLTLATCNTFAGKDDRHIVEAVLIDTTPKS